MTARSKLHSASHQSLTLQRNLLCDAAEQYTPTLESGGEGSTEGP